jgi:hypothetical protein
VSPDEDEDEEMDDDMDDESEELLLGGSELELLTELSEPLSDEDSDELEDGGGGGNPI